MQILGVSLRRPTARDVMRVPRCCWSPARCRLPRDRNAHLIGAKDDY